MIKKKFKNKVWLVDFEDSYTFNILEYLAQSNLDIKVISYKNVSIELIKESVDCLGAIVWGPGPGHIDEYLKIVKSIQYIRKNSKIFQMGICLGHQLLMSSLGAQLKRSKGPLHGEFLSIVLPSWFGANDEKRVIDVQFYNSWWVEGNTSLKGIRYLEIEGKIILAKSINEVSYQFHPESVGTSCPSVFFRPLVEHMQYNDSYERDAF